MFTESWGSPEVLKTLRHYQNTFAFKGNVMELVERKLPEMVIEKEEINNGVQTMEGSFISPLYNISSALFNSCLNVARARWKGYFPAPGLPRNGLVIHLAPTGDHTYYLRKRNFVEPLLALGVSSILLENPFYGTRKPKGQSRSNLRNVSDLYVMGGSMICECCYILRWAREQGHFPLGLSGVSMGGYMASLAATNYREQPIALVPILSWTSAAPVFTQGVISDAIGWDRLTNELNNNKELQNMLQECGWMDMMEDTDHPAYKLFPKSQSHRLMWILMDEFTGLKNYPVPLNTSAVRFVVAENDAYVPQNEYIPHIETLWPGASIHSIPRVGHIEAYMWHHEIFRRQILGAIGLDSAESALTSAKEKILAAKPTITTTTTAIVVKKEKNKATAQLAFLLEWIWLIPRAFEGIDIRNSMNSVVHVLGKIDVKGTTVTVLQRITGTSNLTKIDNGTERKSARNNNN